MSLTSIEAAVNPYIIWIKLGLAALVVIGLAGGGFYAGLRWDSSKIAAIKLADQKKINAANVLASAAQKRTAPVVTAAAVSEGQAQAKIQTKTITLYKEIDHVIPSTVACIPVGLVRLLNGAANGSGVADATFAPGQSDDACSPVSWRSFAADITDDYATGNANAEQLNALEKAITDINQAEGASP